MLSLEQTRAIIKNCIENPGFIGRVKEVLHPSSASSGAYSEIIIVIFSYYTSYKKSPKYEDILYLCEVYRSKMADSKQAEYVNTLSIAKIQTAIKDIQNCQVDQELFLATIQDVLKIESLKHHIRRINDTGGITESDVSEILYSIDKVSKLSGPTQDLLPAYKRIDDVMRPESRIIVSRTPWPTINEKIKGGLGRGEYGVILAYSNVGKSTILCAIGYHALSMGKNVLHITAEDSERETLIKYISFHTKESRDAISSGYAAHAIDAFKDASASRKIGTLYLYETLEYHTKASQIEHIVRDYESKFTTKIDVLIVDYAQILKPESNSEDESQGDWRQIEDIHRTLRKVGRLCETATWSAHQAKEADKREKILRLQHLGKAKACGQVPEIMLSLNEVEDDLSTDYSNMTLFIARNRLGEKNVEVPLRVNNKRLSYMEV